MNNVVNRQIKNLKKINKLLDDGHSIRGACKEIGICMQTYYNIVNKYGKNLEDLNRKIKKKSYEKKYSDDYSNQSDNYSDESDDDVQLFKSDGTPLKNISTKKNSNNNKYSSKKISKNPLKKKPIDQCNKKEIDEELGYFFNKISS